MKRNHNDNFQAEDDEYYFAPNTKKHAKINHQFENKENSGALFSNDVLSVVFSFLPFDETLNTIKFVDHQWNTSLKSDFRHDLINSIGGNLSNQFVLDSNRESMTRLLVKVKHWLTAREHCLNLPDLGIGDVKKEDHLKELHKRKDYPYIRLTEFYENEYEEFAILNIYLERNVTLKMTVLYSIQEDYIIYVDVVEGKDEYDWMKELNIDPHVKRNTVLKTVNDDDMAIGDVEINPAFFDCLFDMLGIVGKLTEPATPFCVLLWGVGRDDRKIEGGRTSICNVEFEKDFEIHEDRMISLIGRYNLELVHEAKVLRLAWKMATRAFASNREKLYNHSVSNVIGSICTFHLTNKKRIIIQSTFDLLFKGKKFEVTFEVWQNFFYGHDGSESETTFECRSKETGCVFDFSPYVSDDYIHWDYPCFPCMATDNPKQYLTFQDSKMQLVETISQLLDIIPRYHLLNDGPIFIENDNLLTFIADHNNGRPTTEEQDISDDDLCISD